MAALTALLERLGREAPVQAAALRLATPDKGGHVSREKVYELGGFSDDRTLHNFTKPIRRLTATLQTEGKIPAGVPQIFVARYPDGVRLSYYSVPDEVPAMLDRLQPPTVNPQGETPPAG